MTGIDYSVRNTWFFLAEYDYRQNNNDNPLYGNHNLFGSVQYIINDLMTVSLSVIGVLPEENVLATVQYSWNILQSVSTAFYFRYYRFDALELESLLPQGEGGTRVTISF